MNLDGTPDDEDIEFYDLYGPWDPIDPDQLQGLMQGFGTLHGPLPPVEPVRRHDASPQRQVPRAPRRPQPGLVRENARAPWIIDCPLNRFLNPEIVLLFKAAQDRPKDEHDLEHAWPLLSEEQRGWLREALHRYDAEHPWNARLA